MDAASLPLYVKKKIIIILKISFFQSYTCTQPEAETFVKWPSDTDLKHTVMLTKLMETDATT